MGKVVPGAPEYQPKTEIREITESPGKKADKQCYHLLIPRDCIDFIERYSYWMSVARQKRHTYSDTISDAIHLLMKYSKVEVKPIPEWVPKRKKRTKKTE